MTLQCILCIIIIIIVELLSEIVAQSIAVLQTFVVIADFLNIVSVYFIYIARLHCLYSSLCWDVMSLPLSKPLSEILGTEGKLSMICEVAGSDCLVVL